jgi:hypothetical protein
VSVPDVIEALIQEATLAGYGEVHTSPHEFAPLKRWRNRGRCRHCLAHEDLHPARGWLPSRPMFDDREAINPQGENGHPGAET